MLRRAIQRTRLHLPAPTGHDNGSGSSSSSSDEGDYLHTSPSVAYTSLRDDESVRDYFRKRPEDISDVHLFAAENPLRKENADNVARMSMDEERRAADVWKRLQTLYGLFQELSEDIPVEEEEEDWGWERVEKSAEKLHQRRRLKGNTGRPQRRRDDGLRSLLHAARLPSGVLMRDLQTLSTVDDTDDHGMPQGFTAGMFAVLGNVLYNEMLVAAGQNRISRDVLEELGNCLYADVASVAVIAVDA
uniref:Uncharacterized protein n=1 Tax=Hyaloperonospora arabidopsidis (strain Emoy2) TaxID=559515 RepID=M4B871_HYAAE